MSEKQRKLTLESFDYQWKHLSNAPYLLSDPAWRANVCEYITDELQLTRVNLACKTVLDAGCGNGRWSYGFHNLACKVYGFDTSPSGVQYARDHVPGKFNVANVLDLASLERLYHKEQFDVVWCWGVLHHTGDAAQAFSNLSRFVKPGGYMHVYVYAKKSYLHAILKFIFNRFSYDQKVVLARVLSRLNGSSVHGNFDAFSPRLASQHTNTEVKSWFTSNGFSYERVYPEWARGSRDIFATGIKEGC